jgi:hypothetical protein
VGYLISVFVGAVSIAFVVLGCMTLIAPRRMIARGLVRPATLWAAVLEGIFWIVVALIGFQLAASSWPLA